MDEIMSSSQQKESKKHFLRGKPKLFYKGLGVAILTATLAGGTSGTERDIVEGSLRPITTLSKAMASGPGEMSIITEGKKNNFMSSSTLRADQIQQLGERTANKGWVVTPFGKKLKDIDDESGLQISIPDDRFKKLTGINADADCHEVHVVTDTTTDKGIGQEIAINSTPAKVVGVLDEVAQMNRRIGLFSETEMINCIEHGTDVSVWGAIVENATPIEINHELRQAGAIGQANTFKQFLKNNEDFWRLNASAILGILVACVGLMGGWAVAGERKHVLQRNVRQIGRLVSAGVQTKQLLKVETLRAVHETNKATLVATPLMMGFATIINSAVNGLKAGVGLREVGVGFTVTLLSKLVGSSVAVRSFAKKLNLAQAVKG
jgi:hypothetical protein